MLKRQKSYFIMPFDIIIIDWNFPKMSGIDFIKEIRVDQGLGKVITNSNFILMGDDITSNHIKRAQQAGIGYFIVKPVSGANVKDRLDKIYDVDPKATRICS